MSAEAGPSTSSGSAPRQSAADRLRNLQMKRNEARKLNRQEVIEEDKRNKMPTNWEARKRRLEWEEQEESARQAAAEAGDDYERVRLLDIQADEAEKKDKKKQRKMDPDKGFADFEQASFRQYQRLTKQMKPDRTAYEDEKNKMGEAFYPTVNTLGVTEHKDSEDAINKMVDDLEKQIDKRSKYSRRRMYNPDSDIDYINERNMKFNQKLERFYGKYTSEIKQNLERGTAI